MTYLTELNTVIVVMALIYWSVSKELGVYLLMGWSGNRLVNGVLKVTACACRPWIRDSRIVPYGNAITTATGYSFPSGHTMNGASLFGGGIMRKDLPRALRVVLGFIVGAVAVSRMYLGVHTPQDVLVGAAMGLLVMWLTLKMMRWVTANPGKDWLVVCVGIGLAVAVALYAALKSYPADYAVSFILAPMIKSWIAGPAGTFLSCFIQVFYIAFIFPWCIKRMERTRAAAEGLDSPGAA